MSQDAVVISCEVRYRALYRCYHEGCSRVDLGTVAAIESVGELLTEKSLVGSPHDMPYHWASYSGGKYLCPEHKR